MDPLYFERVLDVALLSQAEEITLAGRWRGAGDQVARNRLVEAHLRLVPPIARRYYRPGGSLSELIAEGNLGLLRAAAKFDPERGFRFATYALYWIRACVSECAIRNSGSAMKQPRSIRKIRRELIRATNLVGDDAQARQIIGERLGLSATAIAELVGLLNHRHVPLESLRSEWHAEESLHAREPSPEQATIDRVDHLSQANTVREAVSSLNVREQRIVDKRLMADADAVVTLQELGREFGVSRERVRQLEVNVKRKLSRCLRVPSGDTERRLPKVAA
jgi:RNA polymerase sigma-32 factor